MRSTLSRAGLAGGYVLAGVGGVGAAAALGLAVVSDRFVARRDVSGRASGTDGTLVVRAAGEEL